MFISHFQVGNYKSLYQPDPIELKPGFNVICGQNNAGKTALLEVLDPNALGNPHRSLKTIPTAGSQPEPLSWVDLSISVNRDELQTILREQGPRTYRLAMPVLEGNYAHAKSIGAFSQAGARGLVEAFLSEKEHVFQLRKNLPARGRGPWTCKGIPSDYSYPAAHGQWVTFDVAVNGSLSQFTCGTDTSEQDIGYELAPAFERRIFRFDAERLNVGQTPFGSNTQLASNASNLPEVLNALQGNRARFEHFNGLVTEVLPQVRRISVNPMAPLVEVRVWTFDPGSGREDLAMPLAQCGTGIGQVLAILYVAVFSQNPQVIVIDEPQSFLHPRQEADSGLEREFAAPVHHRDAFSGSDLRSRPRNHDGV